MSAHTEGKVIAGLAGVPVKEAGTFEAHHCIRTPGTTHVVALTGRLHTGNETADAASKADAERLAACWNAFEGIATEDIARCHVVGKPIEAGLWSQTEDSRRLWGFNPLVAASLAENDRCAYRSAYKKLYDDWVKRLVREIREATALRIDKTREAKAKEFLADMGLEPRHPVIDPVKPSSDNSVHRQFVCPTVDELANLFSRHYEGGFSGSAFAEALAKLVSEKNGGAA